MGEKGEKDATFSRFQRYSTENLNHVVRYNFDSSPLWFCGLKKMKQDAPACQNCGSARTFEFQIQPQLIAALQGASTMGLFVSTLARRVVPRKCKALKVARPP